MCIEDPINNTCWKNGKDLSNGAPKFKLWNHTKKTHFPVFAKNFRRPCMKLKIFFCRFPNPWTLRVSGMGGYTSKCEKKSKSLHPNVHGTSWGPKTSIFHGQCHKSKDKLWVSSIFGKISSVRGWDLAEGLELLTANAKVATNLDSNQHPLSQWTLRGGI